MHESKMDAIGRLAGGVAHDFNNLLAAIVAAAEHLADSPEFKKGNEEVCEVLDWIQTSAQRGALLSRQLLDFSRPLSEGRVPLDVNASLENVIGVLGPTLGASIEVRTALGHDRVLVCGNESRLQASLMNLALNARDALPDGGEIVFSSGIEEIGETDPRFAGFSMVPGRYVRIEVRDSGTGIPEEIIGQVFEPFFTTKSPGEGSGLGLPLLYNFVSEMRGGVSIESSTGVGTQVAILLPLVEEAEERLSRPLVFEAAGSSSGTILVAEDEEIVRRVLVKMLSAIGFEAIECADGQEALREYAARSEGVDLVLLDVRMPICGGIDVLRALRTSNSEVPVILMSGNLSRAELDSLEDRECLGDFSVLNKPFARLELTKAIGQALRVE